MGLEDRINRLFIRIVMGNRYLKTKEITNDPLPETMGSVKKFFEWGVQELKKDLFKQNKDDDEE